MSPPAGVVCKKIFEGCNCLKVKTTQPATTNAVRTASGWRHVANRLRHRLPRAPPKSVDPLARSLIGYMLPAIRRRVPSPGEPIT